MVIVSTMVPSLSAVSIISGVRFTFRTMIGPPPKMWLRRVNPLGLWVTTLVIRCPTLYFFLSLVDGIGGLWRGLVS